MEEADESTVPWRHPKYLFMVVQKNIFCKWQIESVRTIALSSASEVRVALRIFTLVTHNIWTTVYRCKDLGQAKVYLCL